MRRRFWLTFLAFAGCQSFGSGDLTEAPHAPATLSRLFPRSLRLPALGDDPLLPQASAALERGDHAQACEFLRLYAERHPESKQARVFYAEVLTKLGQAAEASVQFEMAIARLQEDKSIDLALIVHCHGRLLDLADADADDFHVHLHRGLGLYWLAQQKPKGDDPDDAGLYESVLCRAAMELTYAHSLATDEARPTWYLHLIWRQLGQSAPAQRWLRDANGASPFSYLTPRERGDLHLRGRE
jgi:tetratricopeptide (TPR) repeat protein